MTLPDKSYAYEALLRFNYFPMVKNRRDDLPPVFHSEHFTPTVADELLTAMASQNRKAGFDQIEVRTTRFDQIIRQMHIPHPLPYARLCQCLRNNWRDLMYVCHNRRSQIRPERHVGRLVVMHNYDVGRLVIMDRKRFPREFKRQLKLSFDVKLKFRRTFPTAFRPFTRIPFRGQSSDMTPPKPQAMTKRSGTTNSTTINGHSSEMKRLGFPSVQRHQT